MYEGLGAYEVGEVRELAVEAQTYVNESKNQHEAVQRGIEVAGMLNETIDYYEDVVAVSGIYKRGFLLKDGRAKRYLDNKPFYGISAGFTVADFQTTFDDIPDSPRQRHLLTEMQEFTDGHYVVCHRVQTGEGQQIAPDSLIVADVRAYAIAPIGTAAVFPEKINDADMLLGEERQEEAKRIIASAGPFYQETMDKIEMDLGNSDVVKGLITSARKFRSICETGDKLVLSAAIARISGLAVDRLKNDAIMISGDIPTSLVVNDDMVAPVVFNEQSHYLFLAERVATAPYFKQSSAEESVVYEDHHALYLLGRLLDAKGNPGQTLLLPLEDMHSVQIDRASQTVEAKLAQRQAIDVAA